jgi:hypothetical protein
MSLALITLHQLLHQLGCSRMLSSSSTDQLISRAAGRCPPVLHAPTAVGRGVHPTARRPAGRSAAG